MSWNWLLSINLTRTFEYFRVFFILIRTTTRNIGLQTKVTVNIKKNWKKNGFTLYWCFHFTYSPFKIIFNSVTSMCVCMLKYAYQFAKKMIMIMIIKIQPLDKLSTANFIHVQQDCMPQNTMLNLSWHIHFGYSWMAICGITCKATPRFSLRACISFSV